MFGDEPEERPRRAAALKRPAARFGNELKRPKQRSGPIQRRFTVFGDEPEEMAAPTPSSSSKPGRSSAILIPDDGQEDHAAPAKMLSINWSGMKLFSQNNFLKNAANATGRTKQKRPYDNSNRAANASPKLDHSYKHMALDPARLKSLNGKPYCKCFSKRFTVCHLSFALIVCCAHYSRLVSAASCLVQGASKNCYKNLNMQECKKFLETFWNLSKAEQDSFEPWTCL